MRNCKSLSIMSAVILTNANFSLRSLLHHWIQQLLCAYLRSFQLRNQSTSETNMVTFQTNSSCSSHGWFRHSAAEARITGLYSSIGSKKSENFFASIGSQSYFSISTFNRLHGFNFVMLRKLPTICTKIIQMKINNRFNYYNF